MKSKLKKIMGACLVMVLAFSLALPLPVYAGSAVSEPTVYGSNYEFDEATGHLTIGKVIEKKSILEINSIPKDKIKKNNKHLFMKCAPNVRHFLGSVHFEIVLFI